MRNLLWHVSTGAKKNQTKSSEILSSPPAYHRASSREERQGLRFVIVVMGGGKGGRARGKQQGMHLGGFWGMGSPKGGGGLRGGSGEEVLGFRGLFGRQED
eukprot:4935093-Pyramimonas_sp.AAC.2